MVRLFVRSVSPYLVLYPKVTGSSKHWPSAGEHHNYVIKQLFRMCTFHIQVIHNSLVVL